MKDKTGEKKIARIRQKIEASDEIIYLVGNDLFRESATKDVKWLLQEVESCWEEISTLNESIKILTEKVK